MQLIKIRHLVITSTSTQLLLSTLILLMLIDPAKSLELIALGVPGWAPLGTRAALSCSWQLGPADVLYSVKWYKDGMEFFRYVPRDAEPRRKFPLLGVDVEESDSSGSKLVLSPATLDSSGRYRCEVSGEGPLFQTVSHHADLEVVAIPEHGPVISGFHPKYRLGDRVRSNCTSGRSRPATHLSWHINGEPLPIEEYTTSYRSENSLIVTSLTLDFEVTEVYFRKRELKVKCLATITPVYWKSNEEIAVLEKTIANHETGPVNQNQKAKRDRSYVNFANTNFLDNSFKSLPFLGVLLCIVNCLLSFELKNNFVN